MPTQDLQNCTEICKFAEYAPLYEPWRKLEGQWVLKNTFLTPILPVIAIVEKNSFGKV